MNKSFGIRLDLILLSARLPPPVAFLKQLFTEVHERVVEPEQAVAEQEAQVAPKVRYEVGGVVDVELFLHGKLVLGKEDGDSPFVDQSGVRGGVEELDRVLHSIARGRALGDLLNVLGVVALSGNLIHS